MKNKGKHAHAVVERDAKASANHKGGANHSATSGEKTLCLGKDCEYGRELRRLQKVYRA